MSEPSKPFSLGLWLTVALIVAVALIAAYTITAFQSKPADNSSATLRMVGLDEPVHNRLSADYADADGDLVADAPTDPQAWLEPDPLMFSYIASEEENEAMEQTWSDFTAHLEQATGRSASYQSLPDPQAQLRALKEGRLHVTGFNAGNVPLAVNASGFIPICGLGAQDDTVEYTMQLIVPSDSPIQTVADLGGHTLALTRIGSNSGFKAPLVILMQDFGLQVERDFYIQLSRGHDASIEGVAEGRYEAAAVASDLLQRAFEQGRIPRDAVRVIYSSERFVPSAFGYTHRLEPSLAKRVRDAFLSFDWAGTALAEEFGASGADRFLPIHYKDEFALVRRIDDAIGFKHSLE